MGLGPGCCQQISSVGRALASISQHDPEVEGSMLARGMKGYNSLAATDVTTVPGDHGSRSVHVKG